ncbi:hypothetical protein T07_11060 [Trichinella nelsoni]|uniref:Uncharacterized protein n=1 Tax=Trichinella nelsoni TaxID=6336 RepID=A0A0V0RG62_9BILA|nr:hypothetical protein T07_11060 [Trichinella nelsoni]
MQLSPANLIPGNWDPRTLDPDGRSRTSSSFQLIHLPLISAGNGSSHSIPVIQRAWNSFFARMVCGATHPGSKTLAARLTN